MDEDNRLVGVIPSSSIVDRKGEESTLVENAMLTANVIVHPDEVLQSITDRMAAHGVGAIPDVSRDDATRLEGLIT